MKSLGSILRSFGLEYFSRYYSQYRGVVTDNSDPEMKGRLRVSVPQIYGKQDWPEWVPPASMPGGDSVGLYLVPAKGDLVWVAFQQGDPRYPVWQYGPHRQVPEPARRTTPGNVVLYSSTGHYLELDDDNALVRIKSKDGAEVVLKASGVSVVAPQISLGSLDGSAEKAVLGDTLKMLLEAMLDAIMLITVPTGTGPSGVPINAAQFSALKAQLETALSTKVTLD